MPIFELAKQISDKFVGGVSGKESQSLAPAYINRKNGDQARFIKMLTQGYPEITLNILVQQYVYQVEGNLEALYLALNFELQSRLLPFLKVNASTDLAESEQFIPRDKSLSLPYIFLRRYQDLDDNLRKIIITQKPFCSDQDFCEWLLWQDSLDNNDAFKLFVIKHELQETISLLRSKLWGLSFSQLTDMQKQIYLRQLINIPTDKIPQLTIGFVELSTGLSDLQWSFTHTSIVNQFLKVNASTALTESEQFIPREKSLSLPYIFLRRYQDLDDNLRKIIIVIIAQRSFFSDQDFKEWLLWQDSLDNNGAFKSFVIEHKLQETINHIRSELWELSFSQLTDMQKQIYLRQLINIPTDKLPQLTIDRESLAELSTGLSALQCMSVTRTSNATLDGIRRFINQSLSKDRAIQRIRESIENLPEYRALLSYKDILTKDTGIKAQSKIKIINLIEEKRQNVQNYEEFLNFCKAVYTTSNDVIYHLGTARSAWGYIKNCLSSCCSFFKPVRSQELLNDMTAAVTKRQLARG